jgi:hypothetical protein
MYEGDMLSFLIVTKGECPEFISVTFPEGGLGYVDEWLDEDYYIVETQTTNWS